MLFPEKFAKASQRFQALEFYGLHWRGSFTDDTHFIVKSKNRKIEQLLSCFYYFILLKGDFYIMKEAPK